LSDELRTSWNREWQSELYRQEPDGTTRLEKRIVSLLLEGVSEGSKKTALSIGCGPCTYERMIATELGAVIGMDISEAALQMAKRAAPANLHLVLFGGTDLQLIRDSQVDLAIFLSTFQHLPAKTVKRYLEESFRVLKPGGTMKCNLIDRKQLLRQGLGNLLHLRIRLGGGQVLQALLLWGEKQLLHLPSWPVGKPWSKRELREVLEGIGFRDLEFRSIDPEIPEALFLTMQKT
jgi:ubiquinone/menaquinone biosynthesis C-methylase UbiE